MGHLCKGYLEYIDTLNSLGAIQTVRYTVVLRAQALDKRSS